MHELIAMLVSGLLAHLGLARMRVAQRQRQQDQQRADPNERG